ncbi:hypothetical protein DFH07DRAFT_871147 [Mycena maculata]|uniref:Peroxidase n=1 Tax=Mycena maculata TaxID=230809 RepID=A0AAD7HYZ3_9AGAR|nr:hypothetical protein DFH07DRAFT_871147 [Mycena maculata]
MLSPFQFAFLALALISASEPVLGRERWLERGGRAIQLNPRRFGQDHPAVLDKLRAACGGGVCAKLAGGAVTPLLAAQGECTQQDFADHIIDTGLTLNDTTTLASLVEIAKEYRQTEKNTPPDFSTNPSTPRNSVFCQTAPKHAELNGLVQAQDPANGNVFFDPATKKSVQRGAQANTIPFAGPFNGTLLDL